MKEAVVVFSRLGLFSTNVEARDIHSHEHARKLWPLVTSSTPRQLVTWVRPTFKEDKCTRRSHFRTLSGAKNLPVKQFFDQEETARLKASNESPEHLQAKQLIADALRRRLEKGVAMPWYFRDPDSSDFHLAGNLLLGAEAIHVEQQVKTSFGCEYRLDIAITSRAINKSPILLGGVEIEWGHQFGGRKALIGKTQAFPLISIDISGMSLNEITSQWADAALTATTKASDKGLRKTYIYLHDILYPLYLQIPTGLVSDERHQFLIFAPDKELEKLLKWSKKFQSLTGLNPESMAVSIINAKSQQSRKMLENAGNVVGQDWSKINAHQCLRLTIERPSALNISSHLFHLCIARLLLSHTDSLVGYKYMTGILNEKFEDDVWTHSKWNPTTRSADHYKVLPKRLAEPRSHIIEILNSIGNSKL